MNLKMFIKLQIFQDHAADLVVGVLALELAAREDRVGQTHGAAAPHLAQNLEGKKNHSFKK